MVTQLKFLNSNPVNGNSQVAQVARDSLRQARFAAPDQKACKKTEMVGVAVKELKLSYHNGYTYIYTYKRGLPQYSNLS